MSQPLEENPPTLKVFFIRGDNNRFCHDAILGLPGMNRLRVGYDGERVVCFLWKCTIS
jgi:hypothetical protein